MSNTIDIFKVFYICRKTNLCLVLKEDYSKEDYSRNNTNFIETFKRIIKETEYTKVKVIDNKLQLVFQSFKRNCTKLDLEDNDTFKLLYIEGSYLFHFNHTLEQNQNLEFGKNNKTGECGFEVTNELKIYYKNKINQMVERIAKCLDYNEIKNVFFNHNEVYSFEPVVFCSKRNKLNNNNINFRPLIKNTKIS